MSRWSLLQSIRLLVVGKPLNRLLLRLRTHIELLLGLLQTPALQLRLRPRDSRLLLLHDTDDFDGPAVDLADLNHSLLHLLLLRYR